MMESSLFDDKLLDSLRCRQDLLITQHNLAHETKNYQFLKIVSKNIRPQDKVVLISAGMHGDEIAGPLTILEHINLIIDYIHANNLSVIIYPNINPYGFEHCKRYEISSNREGVYNDPNNFIRYILHDGTFSDGLKDKNVFKEWLWSSDEDLDLTLPDETLLMHQLLKKDPLHQVVAAIDLHQDYLTPNAPPAAYQYIYGDSIVYSKIYSEIERRIPILRNSYIDAGYINGGLLSDAYGSLVRYDGSLSDLMQRLGAQYVVTVETTGTTPLETANEINLAWIIGIVDLIVTNSSVDPSTSSFNCNAG